MNKREGSRDFRGMPGKLSLEREKTGTVMTSARPLGRVDNRIRRTMIEAKPIARELEQAEIEEMGEYEEADLVEEELIAR